MVMAAQAQRRTSCLDCSVVICLCLKLDQKWISGILILPNVLHLVLCQNRPILIDMSICQLRCVNRGFPYDFVSDRNVWRIGEMAGTLHWIHTITKSLLNRLLTLQNYRILIDIAYELIDCCYRELFIIRFSKISTSARKICWERYFRSRLISTCNIG